MVVVYDPEGSPLSAALETTATSSIIDETRVG